MLLDEAAAFLLPRNYPLQSGIRFFTGEFFLIVWNENFRAAEKFPVSEIDAARLSNESVPPDLSDRLQDFYRQHTVELSLRLRNRLNAVERCFALFSACATSANSTPANP